MTIPRRCSSRATSRNLEVEGNAFTVTQAELELKVKETEIKVLNEFTRQMELETLNGNLTASKSKLAADEAGLDMEIKRMKRAEEELAACVIKAERSGLVIYPSAAAWKRTPDITEGATVRKDQVLLLMPDLSKMQVKVGIHESIIDRVRPGLKAIVTLPDRTLEAEVSTRGFRHPASGLVDRKRGEVRHDHRASLGGRAEARHERRGGSRSWLGTRTC